MSHEKSRQILQQNLTDLAELRKWLQRSYDLCKELEIDSQYTDKDFDNFENLSSRFARTVDFIINKIFRSIDKIELETSGTTIDIINRAHKRGLFDNVNEIRRIKELRNEIAHEYTNRDLTELFKDILFWTPMLFVLINNVNNYCDNRYRQARLD